jgi:hypothetical protein
VYLAKERAGLAVVVVPGGGHGAELEGVQRSRGCGVQASGAPLHSPGQSSDDLGSRSP